MSHAPHSSLARRHQAVRARMGALGLDALVVTSLPNIFYLTNFTGSTAIVVLTAADLRFITDSRYAASLADPGGPCAVCSGLTPEIVDGTYDGTLAAVLNSSGARRVGFEAAHLTVGRLFWLQAHGFAVAAAADDAG
jgi:Xaa-Pro aminopeptidase